MSVEASSSPSGKPREDDRAIAPQPGRIVLFGSGETSPSGRKVLDDLLRSSRRPLNPSVAVLETPAGFELNATWVATQVADFFTARLAEFRPKPTVIPARRKTSEGGTDDPALVEPLWQADLIFLGAGSPSYAVRHLADSLAWQIAVAKQRLGTDLVLASASTLAASAFTLPVYEIYKAGADPSWIGGLDLFGPYGPCVAFVPHWNNRDGGANLDTSRCFMGLERMARLTAMLPDDVVIVGIDEHTALVVDAAEGRVYIKGNGGVALRNQSGERYLEAGSSHFLVEFFGWWHAPEADDGISTQVWERALSVAGQVQERVADDPDASDLEGLSPEAPPAVRGLADLRLAARQARDWAASDRLRGEIAAAGWEVRDTAGGWELVRIET